MRRTDSEMQVEISFLAYKLKFQLDRRLLGKVMLWSAGFRGRSPAKHLNGLFRPWSLCQRLNVGGNRKKAEQRVTLSPALSLTFALPLIGETESGDRVGPESRTLALSHSLSTSSEEAFATRIQLDARKSAPQYLWMDTIWKKGKNTGAKLIWVKAF